MHSRVGKQHLSITTRPLQSTTVIYYDDAKFSDASMFWKSQDPTENDMGNVADTIRWHSFATKKQCCNDDNFKTQDEQAPMPDILLTFIPGSYPICRAACSTKPQRIVSNLRALFLQTLSAGRIWDITKRCSTLRPHRMKTSTSSSRTSLVGHMEPLRKESAYDHVPLYCQ